MTNFPKLSKIEFKILQLLIAGGEMFGLEIVEASEGELKRGMICVTLERTGDKGYVGPREEPREHPENREASQIISAFQKQSIAYHSHQSLINAAFTGAKISEQTVYDWTYLALAISVLCEFVTADEKFYRSIEKTKLKKHLIWVGDL